MSAVLAIEGGASRTRIGVYDVQDLVVAEAEIGPSNPIEDGIAQTASTIASAALPLIEAHPVDTFAVAAGVAGAGFGTTAETLAQALLDRLPAQSAIVTHDLAPILVANLGASPGLLVIAGTGSSIFVQAGFNKAKSGAPVRVGGRGPLFSEGGSAFSIARRALRAAGNAVDNIGPETALVAALTEAAGLIDFDAFVPWQRTAAKPAIARLAMAVHACAEAGDEIAAGCIESEAVVIAKAAIAAAQRYALPDRARIVVYGGVFQGSKRFLDAFEDRVLKKVPKANVAAAEITGHQAVLRMLRQRPAWLPEVRAPAAAHTPVTEQRLLIDRTLDAMSAAEIASAMSLEDRRAADAVFAARSIVARAIDAAANAFEKGGRLIYIGAGTSGRLGVLDASECPPTFNVPKTQVVGVIAGGPRALAESVEGAEDNPDLARTDLDALTPPLDARDFLVGISASGTAPYVLGAIDTARERGAATALVTCNPRATANADILIALETGPEVLPGSTRLKAGTATKMVLNQISTGAMALSGRVFEGYMVGAQPVNVKLRKRATRIVAALTERDEGAAIRLLNDAGNSIPVAVLMARANIDAAEAKTSLENHRGNVRAALTELQS